MKYSIANYKGELAGHDLKKDSAEFLLDKMKHKEPYQEWELIPQGR